MNELEHRYRRLLAVYPGHFRRRHGEEIVGVLLDGAAPGQRRPTAAEVVDLVSSGLGARLRPPVPAMPATVSIAARLMYLGAVVQLGVLAVIVATTGRMHAAIIAHDPGYTAAQWHAEYIHHIVSLEIGAPLAACVWVWLARANVHGHGRGWARVLFLAFFGVQVTSLLSGLAGGAFTYAPADALAGIALCVVAAGAALLICLPRSGPHDGRTSASRHRRHGHAAELGSDGSRGA